MHARMHTHTHTHTPNTDKQYLSHHPVTDVAVQLALSFQFYKHLSVQVAPDRETVDEQGTRGQTAVLWREKLWVMAERWHRLERPDCSVNGSETMGEWMNNGKEAMTSSWEQLRNYGRMDEQWQRGHDIVLGTAQKLWENG